MNYDDTPSGREMDALVAEKVMGWKRRGKGDHTKPMHFKSLDYPGEILSNWASKGEHDYLESPMGTHYLCACANESQRNHIDLPEYSTDISAAWEVVEKMMVEYGIPEGWPTGVSLSTNEPGKWLCIFSLPNYAESVAQEPSLAICRAALKAAEK